VVEAIETLMHDAQPQCDDTGLEIRHKVSGNSLFLSYRDPDVGGVSQEFAVVSLIASGFSFGEHFGSRLCAVFDVTGEEALKNIPAIKKPSGQRMPSLA
jgi:hypothetical protein